jgi:hypothetical protein
MAQNVKVRLLYIYFLATLIIFQFKLLGKQEELAEIQYYFQMIVNDKVKTLASCPYILPPMKNCVMNQTKHSGFYQGNRALKIVDVKTITAVVSLAPLPAGPEGALLDIDL